MEEHDAVVTLGDSAERRQLVMDPSGLPKTVGATAGSHSIVTVSRLAGNCCWLERRMFELVGAWVADETDDEVRIFFDVQSKLFGWHSGQFEDRLPVLADVDRTSLIVAPSAEVSQLLSAVAPGGTLLRLVALARVVLPRLVVSYNGLLVHLSPVADAPLIRTVQFVLRDQTDAWQLAESLVQTLLHRPNDVDVVTAHQLGLETVLAGVGPGLLPLPPQSPDA